jgi:alpha-ketoglutarate-dependent taurine dioxygenase
VKVRELTTSFGALLELDLRQPLDPAQQREIQEVFTARHLLVFREQDISFEDQVRVVGYLGPVLAGGPEWVSNVRENGLVPEGALLFHSDFIFTAQPSLGLCLFATEVPPGGSPTNFADAVGGPASGDARHSMSSISPTNEVTRASARRPSDRRRHFRRATPIRS